MLSNIVSTISVKIHCQIGIYPPLPSNAGKDERTYQAYVRGLWCLPLSFKDLCFSLFLPGSDFGMISRKRYFVWPRVISSNLLVKSQRVVVPMKSTMRKNPPILLRYFQVSCQSQVKPASIEHVFPPHGSIYLCEKWKQFPCTRPLQQLHC